jgi:hypothetical protein
MANANHVDRNRLKSVAALEIVQQTAGSCPISSGLVGLWNDAGTIKWRDALGNDSTIPMQSGLPVFAAATKTAAPLPACTYANGTAGVGATLTANANGALGTVGGVNLTSSYLERTVLVDSQVTAAHNGLYSITSVGGGGSTWVLTRVPGMDGSIVDGAMVGVQEGTFAGILYDQTETVTTVGTSDVAFAASSTGVTWAAIVAAAATANSTLALKKETNQTINVAASTTAATAGANLSVAAGAGSTTGTGGTLALAGGAGGNDGVGGVASLTAGAAGGATRAGGAVAVAGGAGLTTGAGGAASLTGGAGGNDAVGGASSVVGGAAGGGNRAGGAASLTGGVGAGSAAGGAASVAGGEGGATGAGGAASLVGGAAGGAAAAGGGITITGGLGNTTGAGGAIAATGGAGGNDAVGGAVSLTGGAAGGGNRAGGAASLVAGAGAGSAAGGAIAVTAGAAGATGTGGTVAIAGGVGGATSGVGGAITITGGAAQNDNDNGGAVTVEGGAKNGTGLKGFIYLKGRIASGATDQVIADPGTGQAIPVTTSGVLMITTAAAETNTLADPTFVGQELSLICDTYAAGDRVVTSASSINQANNTIMTFGAAADMIVLRAMKVGGNLRWRVVANDGVSLS